VRRRECSKDKTAGIIKMTMCLEREQDLIHNWMANVTARLHVVERDMGKDKKINGLCCMIFDIEKEIKNNLDPHCSEEAKIIVRIYRAVLEDVLDLVCRNSKCNNFLKGYKIPKTAEYDEIIAILLRIVFSLDTE
jgi:predicted hydrolase (HD superfamily)